LVSVAGAEPSAREEAIRESRNWMLGKRSVDFEEKRGQDVPSVWSAMATRLPVGARTAAVLARLRSMSVSRPRRHAALLSCSGPDIALRGKLLGDKAGVFAEQARRFNVFGGRASQRCEAAEVVHGVDVCRARTENNLRLVGSSSSHARLLLDPVPKPDDFQCSGDHAVGVEKHKSAANSGEAITSADQDTNTGGVEEGDIAQVDSDGAIKGFQEGP